MVLSSHKGGGDHFGNAKFTGLEEPRPPADELSDVQLRALTRRALELGNHPIEDCCIVGSSDSVVLLANRHAEPAVVSTVIEVLNQDAPGSRITILSQTPTRFSGATSIAISAAEAMSMPAPGIWSRRDITYRVPKAVLECDRLISIAPIQIESGPAFTSLDTTCNGAGWQCSRLE